MGKGDLRRPTHVDEEVFARRWERTFDCGGSRTDTDKCPQNATVDLDINPAEWEARDE